MSVERQGECKMEKGLVSVIMLSYNRERYVADSVRSLMSQTYQKWELLFVDDNSEDDTIKLMMKLMAEDVELQKSQGLTLAGHYPPQSRIKVSHTTFTKGSALTRNGALREAKGQWIAFLDAGDLWEPQKLEKQIAFMEDNGHAFCYSKFRLINEDSSDKGIVMGGIKHVTRRDLEKCCWMTYLTVMYDAEKVGLIQVKNRGEENDFALWLKVSEKADCYLLDECLASQRSSQHLFSPFPFWYKLNWRYQAFRIDERRNPIVASFMTVRNLWGGIVKKMKYVERRNRE